MNSFLYSPIGYIHILQHCCVSTSIPDAHLLKTQKNPTFRRIFIALTSASNIGPSAYYNSFRIQTLWSVDLIIHVTYLLMNSAIYNSVPITILHLVRIRMVSPAIPLKNMRKYGR